MKSRVSPSTREIRGRRNSTVPSDSEEEAMPPPLPKMGTKKAPHEKEGKHSPISQCGQGERKTFGEKTCRGLIYNLVEWEGIWVEGRAYGGGEAWGGGHGGG